MTRKILILTISISLIFHGCISKDCQSTRGASGCEGECSDKTLKCRLNNTGEGCSCQSNETSNLMKMMKAKVKPSENKKKLVRLLTVQTPITEQLESLNDVHEEIPPMLTRDTL